MTDNYNFFERVNSNEATELDMIEHIEAVAKNRDKLKILLSDVKKFDIDLTAEEIVNDMFNIPSHKKISNNFKKFKQLIELELSKKESKKQPNENLHPSIFEDGAFEIFLKWIDHSYNDDPDKKISFIFQKLKTENKLRNTNFKKLSEWANKNNYIDDNTFNKLLSNGSFISPSKILTKGRVNIYNSILGN